MSKNLKIIVSVGIATLLTTGGVAIFTLSQTLTKTGVELSRITESLKTTQTTLEEIEEDYTEYKKESLLEKEVLNAEIRQLTEERNSLQTQLNSMNNKVSFNPVDVRQPSNATEYHLHKALQPYPELKSLSSAFVQAEQDYGVNAYFLTSIVALESGWGKSTRANNGSNNLSGYAVYSPSSRGRYFNSKEESILETAKLLANDYLHPNANYYNGVSVKNVNVKYSASDSWATKVTKIANDLVQATNS